VPGHTILDNSPFAPLARSDKPHIIDNAAVKKVFADPDTGRIDMPSYGTALKAHIEAALADGREVTIVAEGKRHKIVRVSPLGFVDENGNPWGSAVPLFSLPKHNDHFEIGPSSPPVAPPAVGAPAAAPASEQSTQGAAAPSEKKAKKPKAEAKPKEAKAKPAETTRDLAKWWDDELDTTGRKDILKGAGIKRTAHIQWKNLPVNLRSKIAASVAEREAAGTMPATQPSLLAAPAEAAPVFKKGDKVRLPDGRTATVVHDATKKYAGNRPDEHFTRLKIDGEKFEKTVGSRGLELIEAKPKKDRQPKGPSVTEMLLSTGATAEEIAAGREQVDVAELVKESTPVGTNAAGEKLYDSSRGRFRLRTDRKTLAATWPSIRGTWPARSMTSRSPTIRRTRWYWSPAASPRSRPAARSRCCSSMTGRTGRICARTPGRSPTRTSSCCRASSALSAPPTGTCPTTSRSRLKRLTR
jgi:hypothetical protein